MADFHAPSFYWARTPHGLRCSRRDRGAR
jgi:hypothetical protein